MEMTIENFISNLTAKFRSKDDDENRVFYTDLSNFVTAVKHENLQDVYNQITMDHTYSTIPRMGKFWKIAQKNGYLKKKDIQHSPMWYKCECGVNYSKEARGCPKCRSKKSTIVIGENFPDNLILVHDSCYYCDIYSESVKKSNERKMYGTECGDYGIKQSPICSACQCRECCRQMMQYNANPKSTTDDYRTTVLAQPWIIKCDKLPETAQKMLDHMIGRRK